MIDQNSQFFAILTNIGAAKQANADALGVPWKLTQMGVGDANGTDPQPSAAQTALLNEWRRAPLNQLAVDPANSAIIIAEQVIPADVGGEWIREIGLYDADDDLVAVANCAPTFKPLLAQGSGRTQVIRINLQVSNTSNVELKIDPSVVLATRRYVDQKIVEELNKLDFKFSVAVATTGPVVLRGLQTLDNVPGSEALRVLVWKQALPKENGIYMMSASGWARAPDADSSLEVTPGLFVHVERGTTYGDSVFQLVTDAPIVLGVTDLLFESPTGRTGVVAGTYRSVTVDKFGRVIGATNPNTLAGYGIDVASQAEAEAQTNQDNTKPMTVMRLWQALAKRIATQSAVNQGKGDKTFVTPQTLIAYISSDGSRGTELSSGTAKLATQNQTNSGVVDDVAVTPRKLSAAIGAWIIQATESIAGIARIAPQNTVNSGVDDTMFVTAKKLSAALVALITQATESIAGILKIATLQQVNAGADDWTAVTPKKLRAGIGYSFGPGNGAVVFPTWLGGFIIQWGLVTVTVPAVNTTTSVNWTYLATFPRACVLTWAFQHNLGGSSGSSLLERMCGGGAPATTGCTFYVSDADQPGSYTLRAFAIGN